MSAVASSRTRSTRPARRLLAAATGGLLLAGAVLAGAVTAGHAGHDGHPAARDKWPAAHHVVQADKWPGSRTKQH